MRTISVLVGMIASGKSTYARHRAERGALVICHDDLTAMLHATYRYEQGLRDAYRKMEEELVRCALAAGRDVVIDRTHLTRESRQRWVDFARQGKLPDWRQTAVVAVRFPIYRAEHHAAARMAADPRGRSYDEWLMVARHHWQQAVEEPLREDERFDDIIDITQPESTP